ncbi:hypothetical protein [Nostoc sp.]|uniref:hypothetical protein n=1 Tax=Nostoc sp. TaxID=1180 RepID=UPI002FFC0E62
MKSTQISSMFMSLTETEEARLCGGESLVVSHGVYNHVVKVKGAAGKPGVKKQTVQSTSTTKVVKITKQGKIPDLGIFKNLFSLLGFDW